jgi:Arc/MetJ-type ribon-helix-helix transcriptional regulator
MKSPGAETSATKSRSRRLSSPASEPETSPGDYSLQWVTARLPPALVREIEAHAKGAGATRSDAIRELLGLGLETIRGRDGVPGGRVEEVLGAIESVRLAVELLGPSTLGTQRLLAHWAARDGGVKVNEDELLAEVRSVGADEWEQAVAEAERNLPGTSNAAPQGERS